MNHPFSGISAIHAECSSEVKVPVGVHASIHASNDYLRRNHLNVYVTMPCPLKVPFSQLFQPFVEEWNANRSKTPIHWPQVSDCVPEGIEYAMTTAISSSQLPDILVTSGYPILFNRTFHERFLKTGLLQGFPASFYPDGYPGNLQMAADRFHVGFLGYSTWGVVHNKTAEGNYPMPDRWTDLLNPEYKGLLSIHGCHGHAGSLNMLLYLQKKAGEKAIEKLADNIFKVRHFAELINEMGTRKLEATPFYLMPYSAISNIPSTKPTEILQLDGGLLTPMMLLVKQSKKDVCKGIIDFFTSNVFKNTLARHAYFQPDDLFGIENYDFPDMELLSEVYYQEANKLSQLFSDALGEKIKK